MNSRSRRARSLSLLLIASSLLAAPARVEAQTPTPGDTVVLTTVSSGADTEIGIRVLREAYRRLGFALRVDRLAGDVALDRANSGLVDGDLQRIDDIVREYPNLVQVPIPLGWIDVAVYSREPALRVRSASDLRTRRVGVVRGILAVQRSIGDLKVRMVDTYEELFRLFATGEVDVMIVSTLTPEAVPADAGDARGIVQNGLLDSFLLYHYLHKDRQELARQVEPVLKEMLLDGAIARIREQVLNARTGRSTP